MLLLCEKSSPPRNCMFFDNFGSFCYFRNCVINNSGRRAVGMMVNILPGCVNRL